MWFIGFDVAKLLIHFHQTSIFAFFFDSKAKNHGIMPGNALNIKDEAMPQGWGMASSVQFSVFGLSSVAFRARGHRR